MKSYVSKMLDDDFTLISLESIRFSYESIEYYQYYLTKKDEVSELVSEQAEGNKVPLTLSS